MAGPPLIERLVQAAPEALAGTARMMGAAGADVAQALGVLQAPDDGEPRDWFEARDPDYIRQTLPALRALSDVYFRGEVRGLEHIPKDKPVLLVGNHSGGTMIADTFVFAQAFYDHFGPERAFHQLAHDMVFRLPGARAMLSRYGTVPASPENMGKALERRAALLVYPGGDEDSFRPSWESSQIEFAGRTGFIRLALEHQVPIIPVVAIGGQETALFLGRGRRLATGLGLHRFARIKVLPPQIGPPWGVTVLDLPGRIPLPAKITVQVLPRIDLRQRLGGRPRHEAAYELVTETMQDALDDLADERTLPVVG